MDKLQKLDAGGRAGWLARFGAAPELLMVMPAGDDAPEELAAYAPAVEAAVAEGRCRPFALVLFASGDWNRDYSPWPAPGLNAKMGDFSGQGPATLAWLTEEFLPKAAEAIELEATPENTAILGYSLAGLFSLWAFYESGCFGAAGSLSGSLWFDGWDAYMAGQGAPHAGSRVYLSLGDAEEKAKNPRMAAVGGITRAAAARLEADPHVAETTLQLNPGGHFKDVPARIAAGLQWLAAP